MDFSLQVTNQALLNEGFKGNFACSPLSINALLNMLAVGSKGQALEQHLGFLKCGSVDGLNKKASSEGQTTEENQSGITDDGADV
ncbi:hypothetical protein L1049_021472 [Liquidambar formosana]|uniref:Serpin domain-containing protein n=1 Tax=Liquidambar formosana TaxID=63359 RepID=A0AAP0QYA6_LIQFO